MKSRIEELTQERDCLAQRLDESEVAYHRRMHIEKADIAVERRTYEVGLFGVLVDWSFWALLFSRI